MTTKRRLYGWSYLHPASMAEDPARCIAAVAKAVVGSKLAARWRWDQCSRKRGHGADGLYCRQHVPPTNPQRSPP